MSDQQQKHTGVILRARRDLGRMTPRDRDFYEAGIDRGRRDAADEIKANLLHFLLIAVFALMVPLVVVMVTR